MTDTAQHKPRSSTLSGRATALVGVPVNLILGLLAACPLVMLLAVLRWCVGRLGWAAPMLDFEDGVGVPIAMVVVSAGLCAVLVGAVNRPLARRTALSRRAYWLVAGAALVGPFVVWTVCYLGPLVW